MIKGKRRQQTRQMDENLRELSALLREGQKRSRQTSYRRRAPDTAAVSYLQRVRKGLRAIVEAETDNAAAWRLLSQAEEALLVYPKARTALEKVLALGGGANKRDLKKLAMLREHGLWWDGLGLTPEQVSELERYLRYTLASSHCDRTLRHTRAWLEQSRLPGTDRVVQALVERGGRCDCQVLNNVTR
jgi:hypothetical protein